MASSSTHSFGPSFDDLNEFVKFDMETVNTSTDASQETAEERKVEAVKFEEKGCLCSPKKILPPTEELPSNEETLSSNLTAESLADPDADQDLSTDSNKLSANLETVKAAAPTRNIPINNEDSPNIKSFNDEPTASDTAVEAHPVEAHPVEASATIEASTEEKDDVNRSAWDTTPPDHAFTTVPFSESENWPAAIAVDITEAASEQTSAASILPEPLPSGLDDQVLGGPTVHQIQRKYVKQVRRRYQIKLLLTILIIFAAVGTLLSFNMLQF